MMQSMIKQRALLHLIGCHGADCPNESEMVTGECLTNASVTMTGGLGG